jgi:hypothetical protein
MELHETGLRRVIDVGKERTGSQRLGKRKFSISQRASLY